jgi:hypothetical protein
MVGACVWGDGGGVSARTCGRVLHARAVRASVHLIACCTHMTLCVHAPVSLAPTAITVGSVGPSTSLDSFSNFGPCVTLFGPGAPALGAYNTVCAPTPEGHRRGYRALSRACAATGRAVSVVGFGRV